MEIDNSLLEQLAVDVFTGMLGMPIAHSTARADNASPSGLMASIRISGDWQAALEVATPLDGARRIASEMFGLSDDELGESELSDALGEIANMIGGNLKGLKSGETSLSLPCVGSVEMQDPHGPGGRILSLVLEPNREPITLRLYQVIPALDSVTAGNNAGLVECPA